MARVTVTRRCGHEADIRIPFNAQSRRGVARIEFEESELCETCAEAARTSRQSAPRHKTDYDRARRIKTETWERQQAEAMMDPQTIREELGYPQN